MKGVHTSELTANELAIMKVLWKQKELSAREVHDQIATQKGWSYSTSRTLLERMAKKGLLQKQSFHGINLYQPTISKAQGLAPSVRHFAEQVLEMELGKVVNLFSGSGALTSAELEELQQVLDLEIND